MRAALSLAVWFALLVCLWELLVGTFQRQEVLGGLIAAGVGVPFVAALRAAGVLDLGVDPTGLGRAAKLAWQLPVEFCVIAWVLFASLARRRRVRGSWVRVQGPARGRGLAATIGTATPNAIVVDIAADGETLMHSLAPSLPGGREVS